MVAVFTCFLHQHCSPFQLSAAMVSSAQSNAFANSILRKQEESFKNGKENAEYYVFPCAEKTLAETILEFRCKENRFFSYLLCMAFLMLHSKEMRKMSLIVLNQLCIWVIYRERGDGNHLEVNIGYTHRYVNIQYIYMTKHD